MSISRGMHKENLVCVHDGIILDTKNEDVSFAEKETQLETITVNKLSQAQTNIMCFLSFMCPGFYVCIYINYIHTVDMEV